MDEKQIQDAKSILFELCKSNNVSEKDILSYKRSGDIALVRMVYYTILKEMGYSLNQIAKLTNKCDHTTVLSGIRRIISLIQSEDAQTLQILHNYSGAVND